MTQNDLDSYLMSYIPVVSKISNCVSPEVVRSRQVIDAYIDEESRGDACGYIDEGY